MRSTPSFDVPICVACGRQMTHMLRQSFRRCDGCIARDTPHSLIRARGVRAASFRVAPVPGRYDPGGCAAAA